MKIIDQLTAAEVQLRSPRRSPRRREKTPCKSKTPRALVRSAPLCLAVGGELQQ